MSHTVENQFRTQVSYHPTDITARVMLAEYLLGQGRYQEAFNELNSALALEPNHPQLLLSFARACRDLGEENACLGFLSRLLQTNPQNPIGVKMWNSFARRRQVTKLLGEIAGGFAGKHDASAKTTIPLLIDLNGDLVKMPADLLPFLWHTYAENSEAIVPSFLAETGHYQWIKNALKPGDVAFDIGANLGIFSTMMARAVGPNGTIHSFEPSPRIASDLVRVLELNDLSNLIINQFAVSDRNGTAHFSDIQCEDVQRESSHLRLDGQTEPDLPQNWISVDTITLDDYVFGQKLTPSLLKIDVEGADLLVLRGGLKTLREIRPKIVLEIHYLTEEFFAELHGILDDLKYSYTHEDKIYYCTPIGITR